MKKLMLLFATLGCFSFSANAGNPPKGDDTIKSNIEYYTEISETPDCVSGWKFVGTFQAEESAENARTMEVQLYYNVLGDKSYKVVVKVDVGIIFTNYEYHCYSCTIDDGVAYFKYQDSSLVSLNYC
ncbi:MAG: hypothetical protein IKO89_06125 [Bacteroidales bacterium]|nr:hypothetical protein [Bacteroidales bacterium]